MDLLDESSRTVSPSDSVASIPSCMPFSWFGEKERDRHRDREKEQSVSSYSLPHTPSAGHTEDGQDRRVKVRKVENKELSVRLGLGLGLQYITVRSSE